jgi:hypothetical protein
MTIATMGTVAGGRGPPRPPPAGTWRSSDRTKMENLSHLSVAGKLASLANTGKLV